MLLIIFFDEIMNIRSTDNKKYLRALNGRTRTIDDGSGEAILMICLVIKEANETLTDEAFKDLRIKFDVSEKVWSKLLQVGMDGRLFKIKSSLPSNYTTIQRPSSSIADHRTLVAKISAMCNVGHKRPAASSEVGNTTAKR